MTFENFMAECGNKIKLYVDKTSTETDPKKAQDVALKYVFDYFKSFHADQHKLNKLNAEQMALKNQKLFNLEQHYEILNDNYNLAFEFFADYFNTNKEANIVLNKELAFEEYTKWLTRQDEEDYENEL